MSDLRVFEKSEDETGNNTNKIYGAAVVAAVVAAVGIFGYATGMWKSPPAQKATFNVASNEIPPPAVQAAVVPPTELGTPTPVIPSAVPVREVNAPAEPVRKAPTIKAARVHVRAPAATVPDEISPVAAPVLAPIDIAPPPVLTQAPPVQTVPVQPAPAPTLPVQPQP